MIETFDFCEGSRVITEIPPEEASPIDMNGWDFAPRSALPYRRTFEVKLHGLRWYQLSNMAELDLFTDVTRNAGRLQQFYQEHRLSQKFILNHEYLGRIECRFMERVIVPAAIEDSNGLVEALEIKMIHHNPRY